jgi:hypothetical protein
VSDERRSHEPTDRLTRLCAAMTETLEAHPEFTSDVKCCVFLDDGKRGGLQLYGYTDDAEALTDLFLHLRAIFRSNGKDLLFAPLGKG